MYSDLFIFSWNLANIFKTLQKNEKKYIFLSVRVLIRGGRWLSGICVAVTSEIHKEN